MNRVSKLGFTIVELMLAMGFVSALLLAIAMTVIQISNIYTKGITYTNVNKEGAAIANELQKSIAEVKKFSVEPILLDPNTKFINNPESGRLCTGKYSYVWNYGHYQQTYGANYIKYQGFTPANSPKVFFVKVYDPNFLVCIKSGVPLAYPDIIQASATELLNASQAGSQFDLAIHYFTIASPSSASDNNTGQQLYNIQFFIGTNDQTGSGTLTYAGASPPTCKISGIDSNPLYCAVTQFDITARAGSSTNE